MVANNMPKRFIAVSFSQAVMLRGLHWPRRLKVKL